MSHSRERLNEIESDFEHKGLRCIVRRARYLGHLCGYVAIPQGHPFVGSDYFDPEIEALNVHGGVTHADPLAGLGETWWLGFDAARTSDCEEWWGHPEVREVHGGALPPALADQIARHAEAGLDKALRALREARDSAEYTRDRLNKLIGRLEEGEAK